MHTTQDLIRSLISAYKPGYQKCGKASMDTKVSYAGYFMYHLKHLQLLIFWHQVAVSLTQEGVCPVFQDSVWPMVKLCRT